MKKLILINAIVWATIILVVSYMFKEVPNYNYFFIGLIFCAGLMNSLIYSFSKKENRSDCLKTTD